MYLNHNQIVNLCDDITKGPVERKSLETKKIKKRKKYMH